MRLQNSFGISRVVSVAIVVIIIAIAAIGAGFVYLSSLSSTSSKTTSSSTSTTTASSASTSSSASATNLPFVLSYAISPHHIGFFVCIQEGFCKQNGINLQPQPSGGSSYVIQLVSSGSVPIGEANMGLIGQAISQGAPLKMVALLWAQDSLGIISLNSSNIKSPSDLVGKTIGEQPGSSNALTLDPWLKLNGINSSSVKVVDYGNPSLMITALITHQVDAVDMGIVWVPTFQVKGYSVSIITRDSTGMPIYGNGIVVNTNFLAQHQSLVQAFLKAYFESLSFAFQNPQQAVQDMLKSNPTMDSNILSASLPAIYQMYVDNNTLKYGFGYFNPAKANQTISLSETLLYHYNTTISANDVYTNSLLPNILPPSSPPVVTFSIETTTATSTTVSSSTSTT